MVEWRAQKQSTIARSLHVGDRTLADHWLLSVHSVTEPWPEIGLSRRSKVVRGYYNLAMCQACLKKPFPLRLKREWLAQPHAKQGAER